MSEHFIPHGIILTERTRPSPIFPVAMYGGPERFLRIDFNVELERTTYVRQVLAQLTSKLSLTGDGTVPCFGRALGFVINYTAERAVVFNMRGEAMEVLPEPYRAGESDLRIKGKRVPVGSLLDGDYE